MSSLRSGRFPFALPFLLSHLCSAVLPLHLALVYLQCSNAAGVYGHVWVVSFPVNWTPLLLIPVAKRLQLLWTCKIQKSYWYGFFRCTPFRLESNKLLMFWVVDWRERRQLGELDGYEWVLGSFQLRNSNFKKFWRVKQNVLHSWNYFF